MGAVPGTNVPDRSWSPPPEAPWVNGKEVPTPTWLKDMDSHTGWDLFVKIHEGLSEFRKGTNNGGCKYGEVSGSIDQIIEARYFWLTGRRPPETAVRSTNEPGLPWKKIPWN